MRVVVVVLACLALTRAVPTGTGHAELGAVASKLFSTAYKHRLDVDASKHLAAAEAAMNKPVAAPKRHVKSVGVPVITHHIELSTPNTTHHGNASRPHTAPVSSGTPLPLDVLSASHDVLVRHGRCRQFCRPSRTSSELTALNWVSHAQLPLPLALSFSVDANEVVDTVRAQDAESEAVVTRLVVQPAAAAPGLLIATTQGVTLHHECRSRGVAYIHITISSPIPGYDPIHLYSHVACAVDYDTCEDVDCGEHGTCVNGTCFCHAGYSGAACSLSDFSDCPNGCTGNGLACHVVHDQPTCVCKPGFSGVDCGTPAGCADLHRCSGHGQCLNNVACGCDEGWTGRTCANATQGDSRCEQQRFCKGHGRCVQEGVDYVCDCDPGFKGDDCGVVDAGCPASCSGHGVCVRGVCQCNFGFRGDACDEAFSPCGGCAHGTCSESIDSTTAQCVCAAGYSGTHCAVYNPSTDPCKNSSFCSGHGLCGADSPTCQCDSGFGGNDCSQVVEGGCKGFCASNGQCDVLTDTCKCSEAWSGPGCATALCPVADDAVCSGHGACVTDSATSAMVCNCASGFFGVDCRSAVCKANVTCSGHGKCHKSSGVWSALCDCDEGWTGAFCAEQSAESLALVTTTPTNRDNNKQHPHVRVDAELSDDMDDFLNVLS